MERTNKTNFNGRNGHKTTVLEKEPVQDLETLEVILQKTAKTRPLETTKEADVHIQRETENKQVEPQPHKTPKHQKPIAWILATFGVGAVAAGSFGYQW